jgi:hypothetical protein
MANTTAINSELFAALVTQAQYAAYENSVARQMVTVFDAPVNSGKVLQVPVWSGITAELITDESAATAKDTNTTSASITLAEHVVYHKINDMLRDSAYSDVMAQIGDQSGRAIAESLDKQVFAEFANFGTNVGGAGEELTLDRILRAASILRTNKLVGPFYAVIHPGAAYNLKKQLGNAGAATTPALSNAGNRVLDSFYIGTVAGVQIYESALVPTVSTDVINGVFASSALGHAMRGTIEMEEQRQAKDRATDVVLKAVAGAATLQASHGVMIRTEINTAN